MFLTASPKAFRLPPTVSPTHSRSPRRVGGTEFSPVIRAGEGQPLAESAKPFGGLQRRADGEGAAPTIDRTNAKRFDELVVSSRSVGRELQ